MAASPRATNDHRADRQYAGGVTERGTVSDADYELLRKARAERDSSIAEAEAKFRQTVLEVEARSTSQRAVTEAAGISTNTLTRWKNGK